MSNIGKHSSLLTGLSSGVSSCMVLMVVILSHSHFTVKTARKVTTFFTETMVSLHLLEGYKLWAGLRQVLQCWHFHYHVIML